MSRKPEHTPEELEDMERCRQIAHARAQLTGPFEGMPNMRAIWWSDETMPGELRLHALWRVTISEAGRPGTFADFVREMYGGPMDEAAGSWGDFTRAMYEYEVEKGWTAGWESFLEQWPSEHP